ncbi:CYTH domain-containing protein [Candidatus Gracilibacteria bacterium]|nr:CYTH domain-containing protein [Candidatus Gracilibacteria bacterium]
MLEKEIKILDIDVKNIQKKLEELGAKKTFEGYIHDIYYDFEDEGNDKLKMEENKRLFRVRQKGDIHMYTIKRKRNKKKDGGEDGVKIADEGERIITDVESFKKVLEKYGMKETREKKKYRISYALDGCEFDIDDYFMGDDRNKIPPLLEIEAKSKDDLFKWVEKLGLQDKQIETWGSRKLFSHYGIDYSWL